jgi:SAM-dependent methyltransferase
MTSTTGRYHDKLALQTRFPLLWLTVQYCIAGYFDRGRQILKHFKNHRRVLEVGCSVGIDSAHFSSKSCSYLGIDVDENAVQNAASRYKGKSHMRFMKTDLRQLDPDQYKFDFILICGTIHHIPDQEILPILEHAEKLLAAEGCLVVIDYAPHANPGWLERLILRLEEGDHVRDTQNVLDIVAKVDALSIENLEFFKNAAFVFPWPVMAHKFLLLLRKRIPVSRASAREGC